MDENRKPVWPEKPWLPDPSTWRGTWRDDWRIMGQEGYLMDKELEHRRYDISLCFEDFHQCDFCYAKFDNDPNHPKDAYFDPTTKAWVCEECFNDFQRYFRWTVKEINIGEQGQEQHNQ